MTCGGSVPVVFSIGSLSPPPGGSVMPDIWVPPVITGVPGQMTPPIFTVTGATNPLPWTVISFPPLGRSPVGVKLVTANSIAPIDVPFGAGVPSNTVAVALTSVALAMETENVSGAASAPTPAVAVNPIRTQMSAVEVTGMLIALEKVAVTSAAPPPWYRSVSPVALNTPSPSSR
jgi:hypothetical protein